MIIKFYKILLYYTFFLSIKLEKKLEKNEIQSVTKKHETIVWVTITGSDGNLKTVTTDYVQVFHTIYDNVSDPKKGRIGFKKKNHNNILLKKIDYKSDGSVNSHNLFFSESFIFAKKNCLMILTLFTIFFIGVFF